MLRTAVAMVRDGHESLRHQDLHDPFGDGPFAFTQLDDGFQLQSNLLDRKGKPKDVFMEDGLHLDEEGYRLWQEALVPFLDAISLDELAAIPLPTRQEPRS